MKTVMVRYKTTETHAKANEDLVRAVFDELRAHAPQGLRYASYRLAAQLKERCVEAPVVTELSAIDAYGLVA